MKVNKKVSETVAIFLPFTNASYYFENKNIYDVLNMMSTDEIEEFECDCRNI